MLGVGHPLVHQRQRDGGRRRLSRVANPESPGLTFINPAIQMAFACENISTDPYGRITFVNLVDQLQAPAFPTVTPQLFLVFSFIAQLPGFLVRARIVIEDDGQNRVAESILKDMAFTADVPIARAVVGLQGLQWPHAGRYVVKFLANGDRVIATFPLTLAVAQLPGQPGGSPRGAS